MDKTQNRKTAVIFSFLITAVFMIPFFLSDLRFGSDTAFHINRIEACYEAMKEGDFFSRIFFHQNYEFGYGSPLFYSSFFLYLPALLRFLSVPPVIAYKAFIVLLTFCSAYGMMRLTQSFTQKNTLVFLSGCLYIFNNFYCSDAFYRGALGEIESFVFFPYLLSCFREIIEGPKRSTYIRLALSFGALLLCHNISFLLACFVFAVFLILNWQCLNGKKILGIALSAAAAVGLTAFFLLPMLEQTSVGIYRINHYFGSDMIGHSFSTLFDFRMGGIVMSTSCGIFLSFCPLLYFFSKKDRFITSCFICGLILFWVCSDLFPWKWEALSFLSILQWPGRCMVMIIPLFTIVSVYALEHIGERFISVLIVLVLLFSGYTTYSVVAEGGVIGNTDTPEQLKDGTYYGMEESWYSTSELSTPDYLIYDAGINYPRSLRAIIRTEDEKVVDLRTVGYNYLLFSPVETGTYRIPFTYYKGYTAQLYSNGVYVETLRTVPDMETGLLLATIENIPENCDVIISFTGTRIQSLSKYVSIVSAGVVLLYCFLNRKRMDQDPFSAK